MRRLLACSLVLVAAVGCNSAGPKALENGRVLYNEAVNVTANEQLLLNLVRLRYRDTPTFLNLTSISTQYILTGGAGLGFSVSEGEGVTGGSGSLSFGYTEKPTISFVPLSGESFVTELLAPIDPATVALLSHSGWDLERVSRVLVQGINGVPNAPSASSPTPPVPPEFEDFKKAAELLQQINRKGWLEFGFETVDEVEVMVLRFAPEARGSAQLAEWGRLMRVDPSRDLPISAAVLGGGEDRMGFNMRSLMGVLYFLSQGVEVPTRHEEEGLVTVTRSADGSRFDWFEASGDLLRIRSGSSAPDRAAVRVRYRGHWYWVADDDLQSKSTFSMLAQLVALQAGGSTGAAPLLTLPLG